MEGAPDLIGRTVGNYKIVRRLGEGGMGAVYEAVHPRIGRRVAIKVILPTLAADPTIVGRFVREARAANRVNHPGLIEVFDQGQLPEGLLYLVMELLVGQNLAERVAEHGPLMPDEARIVLAECAGALAALHGAGMVHRDLKPGNIFLCGGEIAPGRIKILDFGLVKLLELQDGTRSKSGQLMGTPLYMAPEQCEGRKDIDARADVYALGCVVFEILIGRAPITAKTIPQILLMQVNEPAPSVSSLRGDTPVALDHAVARALAKERGERFQRIEDFAVAAGCAIARVPVIRGGALAPTLPASLERDRRAQRRRWIGIAVAGIAASAIAGAALLAARGGRSSPRADAGASPEGARAVDATVAVVDAGASQAQLAQERGRDAWAGGGGRAPDPTEAHRWFRAACHEGSAPACENAALAFARSGAVGAAWEAEARELETACRDHHAACLAGAIARDDPALTARACDAGVPSGCFKAASLAVATARAAKNPRWFAAGDAWSQRAIPLLDSDGLVGRHLLRALAAGFGIGRPRDEAAAASETDDACANGDWLSCELRACIGDTKAWRDARERCRSTIGGLMGTLADAALARDAP